MIQITENNFQETKEKILNDTFELLKIIQVIQEASIHKEKTIEYYDYDDYYNDYLINDYKQRLHELVFNLSGIHLFAELAPKIPNEAIIIL